MEWITENKNPIRHIQTGEVKLSEKEVQRCVNEGIKQAFSLTSNPCISKIQLEIFIALKHAYNKPIINKW